jgi:NADH:ubiquinone oxidoreductase subunit E
MSLSIDAQYDLEKTITSIVNQYGAKPTALIMALQDIQKHYHFLPIDALKLVARKMNLPIAQLYGVATFFKAFSLTPKGKHHICVCTGTACHVRQATVIVDNLSRSLAINPGDTTPDGEISFETVNCLGACALGPLVTVNGEYHGNMTVTKLNKILENLRSGKVVEREVEEDHE